MVHVIAFIVPAARLVATASATFGLVHVEPRDPDEGVITAEQTDPALVHVGRPRAYHRVAGGFIKLSPERIHAVVEVLV